MNETISCLARSIVVGGAGAASYYTGATAWALRRLGDRDSRDMFWVMSGISLVTGVIAVSGMCSREGV